MYKSDIRSCDGDSVEIAPDNTNASIEIGGNDNPTTVDQEGLSVMGNNLIKVVNGEEIHIGENSLIRSKKMVFRSFMQKMRMEMRFLLTSQRAPNYLSME